jgi:cytochrome P450
MSDPELLAIMILLVTGGQHTTMGLLGSAMVILCEKPDLMAELRANRALIPGFIEEALRLESPIQGTVRRAKQDLDVWGAQVPRGATLFPMWGAANSDPGVFANPRSFDMQRPNNRRHFAFGHGRHFCVGAALARAEARMAFETLFTRLKDIRLSASDGVGGPAATLHPSMTTRMHKHIHLEFTKS